MPSCHGAWLKKEKEIRGLEITVEENHKFHEVISEAHHLILS
jgi:hypothetical protein